MNEHSKENLQGGDDMGGAINKASVESEREVSQRRYRILKPEEVFLQTVMWK